MQEHLILQQIDADKKISATVRRKKTFYHACNHFLNNINITMGRDNFFDLLQTNKLLVRKTKRRCLHHQQQTSLSPLSQPGKGFYAT
ncbi:MAG: hypothetical protein WKF59_20085 [Chitinophagaceae bacterium]